VGEDAARPWEWEDDKRLPGLWAKRKVVLSIGYVGTRYHGLQKCRTRPVTVSALDVPAAVAAAIKASELPTVELELEKALHAVGCITTANLGDLDRIGWSRMARTDKVVKQTT
jgi:tRNA U38,U39,U40 pseudouridine synthase TruA